MTDHFRLARLKIKRGNVVPKMMFGEMPEPKQEPRKGKNIIFRINEDLKADYEKALKINHANMTAHLTSEIESYIKRNKKKPSRE